MCLLIHHIIWIYLAVILATLVTGGGGDFDLQSQDLFYKMPALRSTVTHAINWQRNVRVFGKKSYLQNSPWLEKFSKTSGSLHVNTDDAQTTCSFRNPRAQTVNRRLALVVFSAGQIGACSMGSQNNMADGSSKELQRKGDDELDELLDSKFFPQWLHCFQLDMLPVCFQ